MRHFSPRQLAVSGLVCLSLSYFQPAAAAPSVQAGFSPEGSALPLVLNTIDTARQSIRLMGYSFTSPEVVKSLVAAKQRGVDLTAPRPKGRGFPLHGAEPKPLYAIQDLQALRGLTLPARQLLY